MDDSRTKVKLNILKDLKYLGERGGHLWEAAHISSLIASVLPTEEKMETDDDQPSHVHDDVVFSALDVISSITSSSAILQFIYVAGKLVNVLKCFWQEILKIKLFYLNSQQNHLSGSCWNPALNRPICLSPLRPLKYLHLLP